MQVNITAQSQPHRLRERMEEAAVSHGQTVRADLRSVRVSALAGSPNGQIFFCNMAPLRIRELVQGGDGGPLPQEVTLGGLMVPSPGSYDILNAQLTSNGQLQVEVDEQSQVVAIGGSAGPPFAA
jgi:hypothetical protein